MSLEYLAGQNPADRAWSRPFDLVAQRIQTGPAFLLDHSPADRAADLACLAVAPAEGSQQERHSGYLLVADTVTTSMRDPY